MKIAFENTKQQILDVALRQFSQRGYSAVSIRSICKDIGIKESAVYYHFKNKQDILNNLIAEFEDMANRMNHSLESGFKDTIPANIEDNNFLQVGKKYYSDFLNNPRIYQLIGMLMIEQRNCPELGRLYSRLMFEKPVEMQTRYFSLLIEWGYLKDLQARELAVTYQSIFYFCFCRQMAMEQSVQHAVLDLEKHLLFFLKQYKKEIL